MAFPGLVEAPSIRLPDDSSRMSGSLPKTRPPADASDDPETDSAINATICRPVGASQRLGPRDTYGSEQGGLGVSSPRGTTEKPAPERMQLPTTSAELQGRPGG